MIRTTDIVLRRITHLLAPYEITSQQYNVLRILRGAGEDGLPTLAIADRMIERTPGVTRLIDRLVAKGWVIRERSTDDRRRVDCTISRTGLDLLAAIDPTMNRFDEDLLGMLDDDEQATLVALLDRVREKLDDD